MLEVVEAARLLLQKAGGLAAVVMVAMLLLAHQQNQGVHTLVAVEVVDLIVVLEELQVQAAPASSS